MKKRLKITSALILFVMLFSLNCFAGIFYVSPSGNNSNSGTQAAPWKTLLFACQSTNAGDVIHLMSGTFTESVTCNLKAGVSLEGEGYALSIVKSALTGQWSTLLNLESNSVTNGNQTISGITFDGGYVSESNYKTWIGIWVTFRSNVVLRDCIIQGFYNRGVIFNGNGRNESTIPIDPGIYCTGNKVINNKFVNTAGKEDGGGTIFGQLNISGQIGMEIVGNDMNQTQRVASKNGELIKYWGSGYNLGCKILNNILKKANFTGPSYNGDGDWNFAIELFNQSGLEIAGNTIQGSIDLNYNRIVAPYTYSVWIHHNISAHNPANTKEEQGIIFEFETSKAIVEHNKFYDIAMGITFNVRTPNNSGGYNNPKPVGGYSATTDVIIRNNLFANLYSTPNSSAGLQFLTEGETKDAYARNLQIYNNTYSTKSGDAAISGIDLSHFQKAVNGTPGADGITIRNNIFLGFAGQYLEGGSAQMVGITTKDNCIWNCGNSNNPVWTGSLTNTGNLKLNPALDVNYLVTSSSPIFGLGIGYESTGTPPPPVQCTSYVYSAWSACQNGQQTRTVISASPSGCSGGIAPVLTQPCTVEPGPCTYTYSAWSACINGVQTRTVVSALPSGCTGSPVLTQTCTVVTPADTTFCTVILHLPSTGSNLVRRNVTYFVKRSDGKYYDSNGAEVNVFAYLRNNEWYSLFKNQ